MVREHHRRNVWLSAALALALALPSAGAAQDGASLEEPLTAEPGNVQRGKAVAVNSDLGNCLICHAIPIPEVPDGAAGDIGPSLGGVGSRLTAGEMRQRIVDPKALDPQTVMPAYFVSDGLVRVQTQYAGKTILTAQQIEDLVAFLLTLK